MTMETGTTTRVIGWYHSHPHITVLPSHVGEFFNVSKCSWEMIWAVFAVLDLITLWLMIYRLFKKARRKSIAILLGPH